MTGSLDSSRRREPVRQLAVCRRCGEEREGVTTFESMAWGNKLRGRPVHFCDACDLELVMGVGERPLEDVLLGYLDG